MTEGLTQAQLDALPAWPATGARLFDALRSDALRLCDAMTRDVHVPQPLVQAVRARLGERGVVELVATIASYKMMSRFLGALSIHSGDRR